MPSGQWGLWVLDAAGCWALCVALMGDLRCGEDGRFGVLLVQSRAEGFARRAWGLALRVERRVDADLSLLAQGNDVLVVRVPVEKSRWKGVGGQMSVSSRLWEGCTMQGRV